MRLHRFYVEQPLGEEELHIDERELVHQWSSVFRYTTGDSVLLFSLKSPSYDYEYSLSAITKNSASLSFVKKTPNISSTEKRSLYMALVKKDTFETIARQATELLVTNIIPVAAARSEKKNLNFERLASIVREASEQCGRGDVPTVHPILAFKEAATFANSSHVLFDKGGESLPQDGSTENIWIGPEGGWTTEEVSTLKEKGVRVLSLGDSILKADTAASVGMATAFLL